MQHIQLEPSVVIKNTFQFSPDILQHERQGYDFKINIEVQLHNLLSMSMVFWHFLLELHFMQVRMYWNKLKIRSISTPHHIIKLTVALVLTVQTIQSKEAPYGKPRINNSLQQLKLAVLVDLFLGKSEDRRHFWKGHFFIA